MFMMGKFYITLLLLLFSTVAPLKAQKNYNTLIYKGNQDFNAKRYESAAGHYLEAGKLQPKDFTAHYNLGNAFYKRKMYEEAKAEFDKASRLAQNKSDRMAALYNLGNSYMQTNDHEKAADYYKQALKQDPYNEFARKNYQIAMLKDKEKQNNGGKGGGGGNDGKNQQQENDKAGKNQQQGGKGDQQKGDGGHGNNPNPDKNESKGGNMPQDLEDAIMKRTQEKERETARKILNKNSYSIPQSNEKDW